MLESIYIATVIEADKQHFIIRHLDGFLKVSL